MIGLNTALLISLAIIILLCGAIMYYLYSRLNILESSIIEHGKILQSFIMNSKNQNLGNMARNQSPQNPTNPNTNPNPNTNLINDKIDISDDEEDDCDNEDHCYDEDDEDDEDDDDDDKIILSKKLDNDNDSDSDSDSVNSDSVNSDSQQSNDNDSNKKKLKMNTSKLINIEPLENVKRFTNTELLGGIELLGNVELLGKVEIVEEPLQESLGNLELLEDNIQEINILYESPNEDFLTTNKVLNLDIKDENEINLDDIVESITDIKELVDADVDEKKGKSKPLAKMNVNDLRELVLAKNLENGITNNNDDLTKLKKNELLKLLNA